MTDTRTTQHTARGSDSLRLVLVGQTGLDGRFGAADGIDLVRTRTAIEAVGEVASPVRRGDSGRTVVIVGPDAEPNGSLNAFLSAVRLAAPGVRIASASGDRDSVRDGYDAVVGPDATAAAIRRLAACERAYDSACHGPESHAAPENGPENGHETGSAGGQTRGPGTVSPSEGSQAHVATERRSASAAAEAAGRRASPDASMSIRSDSDADMSHPTAVIGSGIGDGLLLGLLDGTRENLLRSAIGLISERVGGAQIVFVDAAHAETGTRSDPDAVPTAPVVGPGARRFGALRSAGLSVERLVPHAAWLGAWLSVHDRQQALRRAAFSDPLTGAWNRRYFDSFLDSALERARASRRTVTVLIFDIDEFKQYNDNYGHPAGDEILVETVRALQSSVRPSDRVCRIGGDEFAVIFDEPEGPRERDSRPPESVYVLAKRVQKKIGEREFPKLGAEAAGRLTISGGLAAFPWDGHDAETLLQKADDLARISKQQGKNAISMGPGAERVCKQAGDELRH